MSDKRRLTAVNGEPRSLEWPPLIENEAEATPSGEAAAVNGRLAATWAWLRQGASEDAAYLVPLRLFIGLGWLRAGAEKLLDPGWSDGSGLAGFLNHQVSTGQVPFPWYETLIAQFFVPHAAALALLILLGQLLAGAAIAAGALTNAALLGGMVMNLNFLLAGAPNPSVFYLVIQAALLLTNAGAVLGLDAALSRRSDTPLLAAQPAAGGRWRGSVVAIGGLGLLAAVHALAHVRDWSPAGSVHDPAMVAAIFAMLTVAWATIAGLRQGAGRRAVSSRRDARAPSRPKPGLRDAAHDPLLLRNGGPAWDRTHAAAGIERRGRSHRRPRRLSLTVTAAWIEDGDDGAGGQDRPGGHRVPAAS